MQLEQNRYRMSEKTATHTESDASGVKHSKLEDLYRTAQDDIQVGDCMKRGNNYKRS